MQLKDRTILITGASTGIGAALVRQLAPCNRLILVARRQELMQQLVDELSPGRIPPLIYPCDVSDQTQVNALFQELQAQKTAIDLAILNAGVSHRFQVNQFSSSAIEQTFGVNFFGVLYFIEHLLPPMVQRQAGLIAVTGSLAGYRGMPAAAPYSASKAALAVFLESLRIDLVHSGVHFTLISPGFVATPMTAQKNRHMPFLMTAERAAMIIINGLTQEKTEIHFPYPLSWLAKFAKLLPNQLYARFMHGRN
ncbi:SDR family NAD(P)-dependent oxidoreductase [candidate division KSB1 bacterium]|nr:SDR family NAD(P)-dependent oxidoreductase [candidate division KSB1 bacterium]